MRKAIWLAAIAAIAAFPAAGYCQQDASSSQQPSGSQGATQASSQAPPAPQESLADAARRAREQKKDTPKEPKVFDNDNIPKRGGISAVGEEPPAKATDTAASDNASADAAKSDKNGPSEEKKWRDRFAKLNHKLEQDQADLDVMQRELSVLDLQYYDDPVKALQQNLTRTDINEKTAKIATKQKQIDADKQAISEAQEDLRKAGGDPGWGR